MSTAHRSRSDAERSARGVHGPRKAGVDPELRIVAELRARAGAVRLEEPARTGIADGLRAELDIAPQRRAPRPGSRRPAPAERPRPSRPAQPAATSRPQRGARNRAGIAGSAALCVLLVLGAMSLVASRDALPGQAFYGVKRGLENASLQLTGDDRSRARKQLDLAASRVGELATLSDRHAEPGALRVVFADFDGAASAGARAMTTVGTNGSARALAELDRWAGRTSARMATLVPRLPDSARAQAGHSRAVLSRIRARVAALTARLDCTSITSGAADPLGALPATVPCQGSTRQAVPVRSSAAADDPQTRAHAEPLERAASQRPRRAVPVRQPPVVTPPRAEPAPPPKPRSPVTDPPVRTPAVAPPVRPEVPAPPEPPVRQPAVDGVLEGVGAVPGR